MGQKSNINSIRPFLNQPNFSHPNIKMNNIGISLEPSSISAGRKRQNTCKYCGALGHQQKTCKNRPNTTGLTIQPDKSTSKKKQKTSSI